jgi:DNA-binding CsgD family transcriptional regulator
MSLCESEIHCLREEIKILEEILKHLSGKEQEIKSYLGRIEIFGIIILTLLF